LWNLRQRAAVRK